MPTGAEIRRSLTGAWRILTFRPDGFAFLARDPGAVWRSFFAMVLAAPAFAIQLETFRSDLGLEAPGLHFYGVWALAYVIFWLAFPVLLLLLGERQGFAPRIPFYLQASNWASVPASYAKLLSTLVSDEQGGFGDVVDLVVILWLLGNAWWILRQTLKVGGGQAAALVVLSEVVTYSVFLFAVSRTALLGLGS
jgi:hypothetical protein